MSQNKTSFVTITHRGAEIYVYVFYLTSPLTMSKLNRKGYILSSSDCKTKACRLMNTADKQKNSRTVEIVLLSIFIRTLEKRDVLCYGARVSPAVRR